MKSLTLHEPWATLIAYGWKEVETRDWYTGYRGPLAIHAAKRKPDPTEQSRIVFALGHRGFELPPLGFGCVVAIAQLAACVPMNRLALAAKALTPPFSPRHGWPLELQFGNYDSGRWAWILRDVQRLDVPLSVTGQRKLWDLPLAREVEALMRVPQASDIPGISTKPATPGAVGASKAV